MQWYWQIWYHASFYYKVTNPSILTHDIRQLAYDCSHLAICNKCKIYMLNKVLKQKQNQQRDPKTHHHHLRNTPDLVHTKQKCLADLSVNSHKADPF